MSIKKQEIIEVYKGMPEHFKKGIRSEWCDVISLGKKALDDRLSGRTLFTPKELNEFIRIVEEYQTCLADQQADQEESEALPVQAPQKPILDF